MKSILFATLVTAIGFAQGPVYKLSPESSSPQDGDVTFEKVKPKLTKWYQALGKDVKSSPVEVRLYDFSSLGERAWRAMTTVKSKEDSVISFDATTGAFQYFTDLSIAREEEVGKSAKTLPKSVYEKKIKLLLKEFPLSQTTPVKLTLPRKGARPTVYAAVFETYKGLPVLDNFIHFNLRDRDATFSYVIFNRKASKFASSAKINKPAASAKAQLVKLYPGKKLEEFRLWYARPQSENNEFLGETARPFYIADFGNGVEAWLDAETGKIVRQDKWHGSAAG